MWQREGAHEVFDLVPGKKVSAGPESRGIRKSTFVTLGSRRRLRRGIELGTMRMRRKRERQQKSGSGKVYLTSDHSKAGAKLRKKARKDESSILVLDLRRHLIRCRGRTSNRLEEKKGGRGGGPVLKRGGACMIMPGGDDALKTLSLKGTSKTP